MTGPSVMLASRFSESYAIESTRGGPPPKLPG